MAEGRQQLFLQIYPLLHLLPMSTGVVAVKVRQLFKVHKNLPGYISQQYCCDAYEVLITMFDRATWLVMVVCLGMYRTGIMGQHELCIYTYRW